MPESIFLTKLLTHANETKPLRAQFCNFYSLKSVLKVMETAWMNKNYCLKHKVTC